MTIPKIIHHIWVGNSEMPDVVKKCIESARIHNKGYVFKLHSEYDYESLPPFIKQCHDKEMWAFVSDYLRFKYLLKYGGIYLDTDMYVLRNFDALLNDRFFSAYNREKNYIYCGIIGCVPNNNIISKALEFYTTYNLDDIVTSPRVLTNVFNTNAIRASKTSETIYTSDLFYPVYSEENYDILTLHKSYTTHLWAESWVRFSGLRKFLRRLGLMRIYHHIKNKYEL